jgi:uncharacterized membrane protein
MPYCSQCGNAVQDADQFCLRCGAGQKAGVTAEAPPPPTDRTAAVLCYMPYLGWIAAIYVLAGERYRRERDTRFHAFQGLYLMGAWLLYSWVMEDVVETISRPGLRLHRLVRLAYVVLSIYLMVKASRREKYRLPVLGDLADQSLREQR